MDGITIKLKVITYLHLELGPSN